MALAAARFVLEIESRKSSGLHRKELIWNQLNRKIVKNMNSITIFMVPIAGIPQ